MSVLNDIRQAVATSEKINAGAKEVLSDFLQAAGPALETLAPAAVQEVLNRFALGDGSATAAVAEALAPDQVVATLTTVETAMEQELTQRAAQVAAARQTMAAIQNAAIAVIARLVVSAL